MGGRRSECLLLVALLLHLAHSSLAVKCGQVITNRSEKQGISEIVGGQPASITDFPWQVSILNEGHHHCGGTILSEWWILSASHCFENINQSNLEIVLGTEDLRARDLEGMKVDRLIMHPFYDSWISDNDIALLLLESPLNWGSNRAPICLTEVTDIKAWKNCWVTGWGATNSSGIQSLKLHKVDLDLIDWDTCFHALPLVTRNMLCAGNPEAGKDACRGDSGGPLTCHKKNNKNTWYQLGIVSWGEDCGRKDSPSVYTRVSNYLVWIRMVTTQASKPYRHEPDSGHSWQLSPPAILLLYFAMFLIFW